MTEIINTVNENDYVLSDTHFNHYNASLHANRMPWIYDNPNYDKSKQFHFKYNNPYAVNLKSHNEDIIANCNKMISKKGSRLIILGDFAWKDHRYFLQKLNPSKKIFIMGNHDKSPQDFFNVFRETPSPEEMSDIRKECNSLLKRFKNGDIDIDTCTDGFISAAWSKFVSLQDWEMMDQMSRECLNLFDSVHEMGWRTRIQKQDVTFSHYKMSSYASSCHNAWNIFGHAHLRMPEFNNVLSCDAGIDGWGYCCVPWCAIKKKMQLKIDWMKENGKYPVDGENKAIGEYDKDPELRVIETRKKNKEIMKSMGYPIDDRMWPTEVLKWPTKE
jgi:calcineurin-like phosphoesterase family protein